MKINELITEIETTKAVESILVKHKNKSFQIYPCFINLLLERNL